MSVTPDVSHVEMWPYAASAAALSESQRATAVLMLSLSSALPATAGTKLATHRSAAGPIVVLALGRTGQRLMSSICCSNRARGPCGFAKHHPPSETSSARRTTRKEPGRLPTRNGGSSQLGRTAPDKRRRPQAGLPAATDREASKDSDTSCPSAGRAASP